MGSRPGERARYWVNSQTGLSLFRAGNHRPAYAPHSHDGLVIAVTEAGGAQVRSGRDSFETHLQRLLLFNPGAVHASKLGRSVGWRHRSFHLDDRSTETLLGLARINRLPGFASPTCDDPQLVRRFLRLHQTLERGCEGSEAEELAAQAFGMLFRRYGCDPGLLRRSAGVDRSRLLRAVDFIHAHHAGPLTLTEIALAVQLSPFELIRLFNKGVGMSPHAFIIQTRLRDAIIRAKKGVPLAAAAVAAGFYDQSAFHRHFIRSWGVTPRNYLLALST